MKNGQLDYTPDEMMTCAAARSLRNNDVCFVGIGAPSLACNLARLTHAPNITLIYESGTLGAKPPSPPLSIGDGELCETATSTVSVPEMFRYWLQGERISIGFLGAAEIDRFGNINTTVIGHYADPKVRLPGAGGAPEIATSCGEIYAIIRHSKRGLVNQLSFNTSLGHGADGKERQRLGLKTKGPSLLITDLCIMKADPETNEFVVSSIHENVTKEDVIENTGWPIRFSKDLTMTPPPDQNMLEILRAYKSGDKRSS